MERRKGKKQFGLKMFQILAASESKKGGAEAPPFFYCKTYF
jgi:hypothetical protein